MREDFGPKGALFEVLSKLNDGGQPPLILYLADVAEFAVIRQRHLHLKRLKKMGRHEWRSKEPTMPIYPLLCQRPEKNERVVPFREIFWPGSSVVPLRGDIKGIVHHGKHDVPLTKLHEWYAAQDGPYYSDDQFEEITGDMLDRDFKTIGAYVPV